MLLFRSEEHVDRWLDERGLELGATMTVDQQWQLAQDWYGGRLDPDWKRRLPHESQRILENVGLMGPFWKLA